MITYLETSRLLIPRKVLSKRDLHMFTSGFSKDIFANSKTKEQWSSDLIPHPHLPKAVIVGFSHCGEQTLIASLATHPDVVINTKELRYFTGGRSLRGYLSHMPPSLNQQVTVDICISCITNKTALKKIKSISKEIKIILVVCDPISRLLDNHTEFLRLQKHKNIDSMTGNNHLQLESLKARILLQETPKQILNDKFLAEIGDYFRHAIDLFQLFPRQRVLFIEKDRFKRNFVSEISRLQSFLEIRAFSKLIESSYDKKQKMFCYNFTQGPRTCFRDYVRNISQLFSETDVNLFNSLRRFYKPFYRRLYMYLEDRYTWL